MEPGFVFVLFPTHLSTQHTQREKSILVMGLNLQSAKQSDKQNSKEK